ncbi:MAG: hypothetical protein RSA91_01040 [Bacilli bacterium]
MNFTKDEAQLIKLAVDETKGVPVANFSSEERNEKIREKFFEILGTKNPEPMDFDEHKHRVFRLIREVVQETLTNDGAEIAKFNSQFVEEETIEYGDKKEYDIENDSYLTVGEISGNNWEMNRQRVDEGDTITIKTSAFYIKIYEYFMKFLAGRLDWAKLMNKIAVSVRKHKEDFITEKFTEALSGIPDIYKYSGSYNESQILNKIAHVAASNKGASITLTGTREALAKLQKIDTSALSDKQKEEANEYGFIGKWKGYNCVALPCVYKENTQEFAFSPNMIYVLPSVDNKPIKIVNEGKVLVREISNGTSNVDMTMEYAIIWKMGGAIIFSRAMGTIEITG